MSGSEVEEDDEDDDEEEEEMTNQKKKFVCLHVLGAALCYWCVKVGWVCSPDVPRTYKPDKYATLGSPIRKRPKRKWMAGGLCGEVVG